MKIIDVEIKKGILGRNDAPMEGIEYCGGWRDFQNMGISVVCVYDLATRLTRVFLEEDFEDLKDYVATGPTGGFNTRGFDIPLLNHHGIYLDEAAHYDALWRIWQACGLDPTRFSPRTHGGWSLDNIMQSTFGLSKSGNGAMAPVWWQLGKRGKVIDYCCRDVWLEAQLIEHMLACKPVFKDQSDHSEAVVVRPL
jgi:hypothetical protein